MKIQSKLVVNRSAFKTDNKKIQSIIEEFKDLVEWKYSHILQIIFGDN